MQLARGRTYHLACLAAEITHLLRGSFLAPAPSGGGEKQGREGQEGERSGESTECFAEKFGLQPETNEVSSRILKHERDKICFVF